MCTDRLNGSPLGIMPFLPCTSASFECYKVPCLAISSLGLLHDICSFVEPSEFPSLEFSTHICADIFFRLETVFTTFPSQVTMGYSLCGAIFRTVYPLPTDLQEEVMTYWSGMRLCCTTLRCRGRVVRSPTMTAPLRAVSIHPGMVITFSLALFLSLVASDPLADHLRQVHRKKALEHRLR